MNTNDVCGLFIILVVLLCGLAGLDRISRPTNLTKEEYETRLRRSSGIASSAMNAGMYALQGLLHPQAAEAAAVQQDMREGHYDIKQEDGDELDGDSAGQSQTVTSTQ